MECDSPCRDAIRALLAAAAVRTLEAAHSPPMPPEHFSKAGILPFLPAPAMENWRVLAMRPVARRPELGAPPFQLCKGTRMFHDGHVWKDAGPEMPGGAVWETLPETALREGIEELGLELSAIAGLYDAGPVRFISAKTDVEKWMWLFAAEMASEDCLLPESAVAATTAERRWMNLHAFNEQGRADHVAIVRSVTFALSGLY